MPNRHSPLNLIDRHPAHGWRRGLCLTLAWALFLTTCPIPPAWAQAFDTLRQRVTEQSAGLPDLKAALQGRMPSLPETSRAVFPLPGDPSVEVYTHSHSQRHLQFPGEGFTRLAQSLAGFETIVELGPGHTEGHHFRVFWAASDVGFDGTYVAVDRAFTPRELRVERFGTAGIFKSLRHDIYDVEAMQDVIGQHWAPAVVVSDNAIYFLNLPDGETNEAVRMERLADALDQYPAEVQVHVGVHSDITTRPLWSHMQERGWQVIRLRQAEAPEHSDDALICFRPGAQIPASLAEYIEEVRSGGDWQRIPVSEQSAEVAPTKLVQRDVEGPWPVRLWLDEDVYDRLPPSICRRLEETVSWQTMTADSLSQDRTVIFNLEEPITVSGRTMRAISVKGIGYQDADGFVPPSMREYHGPGRPSREWAMHADGRVEWQSSEPRPYGAMLLHRARQEDDMTRRFLRLGFAGRIPIGYGHFRDRQFPEDDGQPIGFIMFGISDPKDERTAQLMARGVTVDSTRPVHSFHQLTEGFREHNVERYRRIGRLLRELHDKGLVHGAPHPENFVEEQGEILFVDLDFAMDISDLSHHEQILHRMTDLVYAIYIGWGLLPALLEGYFWDRADDPRLSQITEGELHSLVLGDAVTRTPVGDIDHPLVHLMSELVTRPPGTAIPAKVLAAAPEPPAQDPPDPEEPPPPGRDNDADAMTVLTNKARAYQAQLMGGTTLETITRPVGTSTRWFGHRYAQTFNTGEGDYAQALQAPQTYSTEVADRVLYDVAPGTAFFVQDPESSDVLGMARMGFCFPCAEIAFHGHRRGQPVIGVTHYSNIQTFQFIDLLHYLEWLRNEQEVELDLVVIGYRDTEDIPSAVQWFREQLAGRGVPTVVFVRSGGQGGIFVVSSEGLVRFVATKGYDDIVSEPPELWKPLVAKGLAELPTASPQEPPPTGPDASGDGGPAMRWSGQALTEEQHDIVNSAIEAYFPDGQLDSEARRLEPTSREYRLLDPEGVLRAEGVQIVFLPMLMEMIRHLATAAGIQAPSDLVSHPGRQRRVIYLDPQTNYQDLAAQDPTWRATWARHELEHIRDPKADEATIQARAPLPEGRRESWRAFIRGGIQTDPPWQNEPLYRKFRRPGIGLGLIPWPRWKIEEVMEDAALELKALMGYKPRGHTGLVIGVGGNPQELLVAQETFKWRRIHGVEFVNRRWAWQRRVEQAARYLATHGQSPNRFVLHHADAKDLRGQFPDASIDGVYAAHVIIRPDTGEELAGEIVRVLAPGGYAYIHAFNHDYRVDRLVPFFEAHGKVEVVSKTGRSGLVFQKSGATQSGSGRNLKHKNRRRPAAGKKANAAQLKALLLGPEAAIATATGASGTAGQLAQDARVALEEGHRLREDALTAQETPWLTLIVYEEEKRQNPADMELGLIEQAYEARHGTKLPRAMNNELANRLVDLHAKLHDATVFLGPTRVTVLLNLDDPLKPLPLAQVQTDHGSLHLVAKGGQAHPDLSRPKTINLTLTAAYTSWDDLFNILWHEFDNLDAGHYVENSHTAKARAAAQEALGQHQQAYARVLSAGAEPAQPDSTTPAGEHAPDTDGERALSEATAALAPRYPTNLREWAATIRRQPERADASEIVAIWTQTTDIEDMLPVVDAIVHWYAAPSMDSDAQREVAAQLARLDLELASLTSVVRTYRDQKGEETSVEASRLHAAAEEFLGILALRGSSNAADRPVPPWVNLNGLVAAIIKGHDLFAQAHGVDITLVATEALWVRQAWLDPAVGQIDGIAVTASLLLSELDSVKVALSVLLTNAIKYSQRGGTVTVHLQREDGQIVFQVADRGIGIRAEELPLVTVPGYRSPRAQAHTTGTGWGLSRAKQIVEEGYGGSFWIDSEGENQGTTVTIRIPIDPSEQRVGTPPAPPHTVPGTLDDELRSLRTTDDDV